MSRKFHFCVTALILSVRLPYRGIYDASAMCPDTVGDVCDVERVEVLASTVSLYKHLLTKAVVIAAHENR